MTDTKNKLKLFSEFPPVSTSAWKSKIEQDLKGTPFDKLIWESPEGINIQPFYREEDLSDILNLDSLPGEFPFVRGHKMLANEWEIRQDIYIDTIPDANGNALQALNKGADSICFIFPDPFEIDHKNFTRLLEGIHLDCISINFKCHVHTKALLRYLETEIHEQGIDPSLIKGSLDFDPLGYLSKNGNYHSTKEDEFSQCAGLIESSFNLFPNLRVTGINSSIFHNAGGSAIQDLAFGLAMASDYLDYLTRSGLSPEQIARSMQINFAVGSSYFIEIARLRAARILFSNLLKAWGIKDKKVLNPFIHCSTSEWVQTIYDPYTNMLRATTQTMSAVLGGADSITVTPYDFPLRKPSEFSERIARNIQIILKEEAYFKKVIDPSSGSYYIETLTDQIAKHAWELFLKTEDQGGYLNAFKSGYIQKCIRDTAASRDLNLARRKTIMVGINQYINTSEKITDHFEPAISPSAEVPEKKIIATPLRKYRGPETFEKIRMKTEQSQDGIPEVFLLTFGKYGHRRARAEFALSFFATGGFQVIDNHGFENLTEGVDSANKMEANIVVFCSSDEEYLLLDSEILKKLKKNIIKVIAGNPVELMDELKSRGLINFIHLKSDVPAELNKYQELLGIEITL